MITNAYSHILYALGARQQYMYDGDYFDWLYLAMRWLPNMRRGDVAILPDEWSLHEYVDFLEKTILGFKPDIHWVPSRYLLDDGIAEASYWLFDELEAHIRDGYYVLPYDATTNSFQRWASAFKDLQIIGELPQWGKKFATKAWLHPWANEATEKSIAQLLRLPVLPGFNASNANELVKAWELLDCVAVIIKPHDCSFGDGLVKVKGSISSMRNQLMTYTFPFGPVALELLADIDQDEHGEISWSTHYVGGCVFGPPTRQLIRESTCTGNITPSFNAGMREKLQLVTKTAIDGICPNGVGGFNGPMVNGIPYVTDPNARITGVCSSLLFRDMYCSDSVTLNKKLCKPRMSVHMAWELLCRNGIAFDKETQYGVFIQGWIPSGWSQIICAAPTHDEAFALYHKAEVLLG